MFVNPLDIPFLNPLFLRARAARPGTGRRFDLPSRGFPPPMNGARECARRRGQKEKAAAKPRCMA